MFGFMKIQEVRWLKATTYLMWVAVFLFSISGTRAEVPMDFNGDGRTDYAVVRNMNGEFLRWYISYSSNTYSTVSVDLGTDADKPVPADYDGDLKTDIAVWNDDSTPKFYILNSLTNTLRTETFGLPGDDPTVVGDYDGDGKADVAVFRRALPRVFGFIAVL